MADNREKQSLPSEIFDMVEKTVKNYPHWIFCVLFLIFSLHLAGLELQGNSPYIVVSKDGINKPASTALALLFAGLWLFIWRKKSQQHRNNQGQQSSSSTEMLTEDNEKRLVDHLEDGTKQIERLPDSSTQAVWSAENLQHIKSQRTIGVGLAEWVKSSRSEEKWVQKVMYEINSLESDYRKYIESKLERLEGEVEDCISSLEESFRTHKRPVTGFKACISARVVYREVKRILAKVMMESLEKSGELSYDSRSQKFLEERVKDLKIGE